MDTRLPVVAMALGCEAAAYVEWLFLPFAFLPNAQRKGGGPYFLFHRWSETGPEIPSSRHTRSVYDGSMSHRGYGALAVCMVWIKICHRSNENPVFFFNIYVE